MSTSMHSCAAERLREETGVESHSGCRCKTTVCHQQVETRCAPPRVTDLERVGLANSGRHQPVDQVGQSVGDPGVRPN